MDLQRLLLTSLLFLTLRVGFINCEPRIDYETLENGFYIYRTETRLSVGVGFQQTCFAKINQRETCLIFEHECPLVKVVWILPLKLKQAQRSGTDIRTNIVDTPSIKLKKTDTIVYSSTLTISNLGLIHRGIYSCVLKYIDSKSGRVKESANNRFELEVNGGTTGSLCDFNDQCESTQCHSRKCVCDPEFPVFSDHDGQCYSVQMPNDTCVINEQCQFFSNKKMICDCPRNDSNCQKVCRCVDKYIPATVGLSAPHCMPAAKIGNKCSFSDQCKAMDENSYCGFSGLCECSSGKRCNHKSNMQCDSHQNCTAIEFCYKNVCRELKDIGESCEMDAQCAFNDHNSFCDKGVCVCKPDYKISSKYKCILEEECHSHNDCSSSRSFCEHGKCKKGKKLGDRCNDAIECQANDKKSFCSKSNVCECIPHFSKRMKNGDGFCVSKDYCEEDNDCQEKRRGFCLNNTCNYIVKLNEQCHSTEECILINNYSICDTNERVCKCSPGFESNNGNCEIISCQNDGQCSKFNENWFCSSGSSKCSCFNEFTLSKYGVCVRSDQRPNQKEEGLEPWIFYTVFIAVPAIIGVLLVLIIVLICQITQKQRNSRRAIRQRQPIASISRRVVS